MLGKKLALGFKAIFPSRTGAIEAEFSYRSEMPGPDARIGSEAMIELSEQIRNVLSSHTPRMDAQGQLDPLQVKEGLLLRPLPRSVGGNETTAYPKPGRTLETELGFTVERFELKVTVSIPDTVSTQAGTSPRAMGAEMILLEKLKASTKARAWGRISAHNCRTSARIAFDLVASI